ncbi:putative fucosyltransferase-like protein [Nymphaea thermarum]|nr:putative fucosyltransferase-like protein [Nymphaea thermarum]
MGGRANSANPLRGASLSESWRPRSILMPLLVVVVVLAEISFLGRLNMARNADIVHTWTESFYSSSSPSSSSSSSSSFSLLGTDELGKETCQEWLEREDAVPYSRDFEDNPIWVWGDSFRRAQGARVASKRRRRERWCSLATSEDLVFEILRDDPVSRVFRAEQYFDCQGIVGDQIVSQATVYFEDAAIRWFRWLVLHQGRPDWETLVREITSRFRPSAYLDYNVELLRIKQLGTVVEYQENFEVLTNMVRGWTLEALIGAFVGGLKDEICIEVQATKPQTLLDCFELACTVEEKNKRLHVSNWGHDQSELTRQLKERSYWTRDFAEPLPVGEGSVPAPPSADRPREGEKPQRLKRSSPEIIYHHRSPPAAAGLRPYLRRSP